MYPFLVSLEEDDSTVPVLRTSDLIFFLFSILVSSLYGRILIPMCLVLGLPEFHGKPACQSLFTFFGIWFNSLFFLFFSTGVGWSFHLVLTLA